MAGSVRPSTPPPTPSPRASAPPSSIPERQPSAEETEADEYQKIAAEARRLGMSRDPADKRESDRLWHQAIKMKKRR